MCLPVRFSSWSNKRSWSCVQTIEGYRPMCCQGYLGNCQCRGQIRRTASLHTRRRCNFLTRCRRGQQLAQCTNHRGNHRCRRVENDPIAFWMGWLAGRKEIEECLIIEIEPSWCVVCHGIFGGVVVKYRGGYFGIPIMSWAQTQQIRHHRVHCRSLLEGQAESWGVIRPGGLCVPAGIQTYRWKTSFVQNKCCQFKVTVCDAAMGVTPPNKVCKNIRGPF